jgi:hypothetical protein
MIISKQELKQLVKEELTRVLKEVNGSDSLNIISLEPDEWKSEPELGVGKMKAEYDGETYEFYTVLTADEKDVQIYLLDYSAMGGTHFASRIRHRLVHFPEEQEQQIIAKMTSPEWKDEMAKVVAWSYEDPYIKEELTRVLKEMSGLRDSVDSIAMDVFNKINLELESIEEIQQVIDEPVVLQIIADALITAGALDDNIVDLVPEVQNALEKLFIIQMEQMKGSL